MITQQHRPKVFSEVAGHKNVVDTLKCIAKNPENAPRTIVLQGEFGTGKTTCARILARALNCPNAVNGEPCGNCPVCNADLDICPFYLEFDSAVVGNVETIRDLRDTFYYNSDTGYRVIVLDECHLISKQAQAALLKVFEETKGRIFFVLCTTDAQLLLPTIRSRSLELRFNLIPSIFLKENLKSIAEKEKIDIDDETLDLIVSRSEGHARNAQMLLDRYQLLGAVFKESVKNSKDDFARLFSLSAKSNMWKRNLQVAMQQQNAEMTQKLQKEIEDMRQEVSNIIYKLQCNSLVSLKSDYEDTVLDVLKVSLGVKTSEINDLREFAKYVGQSRDMFLKSYKVLTFDSVLSSFKSDKMFQAAMWVLYLNL